MQGWPRGSRRRSAERSRRSQACAVCPDRDIVHRRHHSPCDRSRSLQRATRPDPVLSAMVSRSTSVPRPATCHRQTSRSIIWAVHHVVGGPKVFQNLRRDLERDCQDTGRLRYFKRLLHPGVQAIALYPCARALRLMPQPFWWIGALVMFIPRYFVSTIYGIMIPINADIGPGFVIHTWGGGERSYPAARSVATSPSSVVGSSWTTGRRRSATTSGLGRV